MSKRIISVDLSESGIDRAIKEVEQYKNDIVHKTELLRQKVAEKIAKDVQTGFNGAIVDDLVDKPVKIADVTVSINERGNLSVVTASGEDAVWIEFGAGVYHNGSVGSSPNPYGNELGMTIGTYGKGRGTRKTWAYYESGELIFTHGTAAEMPMATAVMNICDDISHIAKEVFA